MFEENSLRSFLSVESLFICSCSSSVRVDYEEIKIYFFFMNTGGQQEVGCRLQREKKMLDWQLILTFSWFTLVLAAKIKLF